MTPSRTSAMYLCRALAALLAFSLVASPSSLAAQSLSRWFLAEGANNAIFAGEILVGNPSSQALEVTIRLLPQPDAAPLAQLSRTFPLAPTSRLTVKLGQHFGLNGSASAEVTAVVAGTSTPADIVVERSMYFTGGAASGGHNASGVTEAASVWVLAEGATTIFDTFVLVANPNAGDTHVRATYLTATGQEYVTEQVAPPNSRATFWPRNEHAALQSAEFSTVIESLTPAHDVVAERAMYFDYPGPDTFARSGHDALGVSSPHTTWYFAEGYTGGNTAVAFDTFLLLGNQGTTTAQVTVTYQLDSGEAITREYTVPGRQRFTVWVDQEGRHSDPRLERAAFGMTVQSTVPIVAERAMYWGAPSASDPATPALPWTGGHATAGSPVQAARWGFAEGLQDFRDASGDRYETFVLLSNPSPSPIVVRGTFVREDGRGVQYDQCVPGNGRANIWTATLPALSHRQFAVFAESVASTAAGPCGVATAGGEVFVAERAVYWGAGFTGGHVNIGTPWTGAIVAPPAPNDVVSAAVVTGSSGRLSGGDWIDVSVSNVAPSDVQVFVGGLQAPQVQFVSASHIRVRTPVRTAATGFGSAGTRAVVVNSRGQSVAAGAMGVSFRVLAVGDSFTEGLLVERVTTITPPQDFPSPASPPYPEGLRGWLAGDARLGSGVVVSNEGRGGECASVRGCSSNATSGAGRIEGLVNARAWDVVIVMEGFNDLNDGQRYGASLGSAVNALRFMGRTARASGATVVMGILEPSMNTLSGAIASMADAEGFQRHTFRNVELGTDDVHPTQDGYDRMAREMYDKLKALFP